VQIAATISPEAQDRAAPGTGLAHVVGRPQCLRQVGDEDRDQQGDADALAGGDADAEHRLLGYAVEEGAERERGAAAVLAAPAAPAPGLEAAGDQPVEEEVDEGADAEADAGDRGAAGLQALLRELEADRADQGAGAEGEDQSDLSRRPAMGEAEQRSNDERACRERSPADRRSHLGYFARHDLGRQARFLDRRRR
jgi:hypothetical protein